MAHGLMLGNFAPLHQGHIYLIEQARSQCDALTILVTSQKSDSIPGWQRYHWVKSTFPELDVRHVMGPEESRLSEIFRHFNQETLFFESGYKYKPVVQRFDFQHITIDLERKHYPVPTSEIRKNLYVHWELLPRHVRPFYIRRVALVGPESCGKSYLAEQLALHFNTVWVEEYGRTYCEKFGMDSTPLDFAHVAGGQLYYEDERALEANRLLFCDTDLIVTQIWSEVYFKGACQPWIFWANHARRYDLFLLCAPDIPWVNDGLREYEDQREWMFERLKQELESRGLNYGIIKGDFEERTALAIQRVDRLLKTQE